MFRSKTFSFLIILLFLLVSSVMLHAQETLVVGDSTITKVDSLTYATDDVVVTATE